MTLKYWFNCFGFHRIVRVGLCLLSGSVLYKCACGSHASAAKYQEFTILLNFFLLVITESPFFPQWEENQIYILGAFSAYLVYSFAIYFPILCRRQKSPPDLEESVVCLWQREVVKSNMLLHRTPNQPGHSYRGNKGGTHFNHSKRQKMRTR